MTIIASQINSIMQEQIALQHQNSRRSISLRRPGWIDIVGSIFLFFLVYFGHSLISDPGIGWHLKNGEWILKNSQVPQYDHFLFTSESSVNSPPKSWVSDQWLSDAIIFLLYKVGGWSLLHILTFGFVISIYLLVMAPILRAQKLAPIVTLIAVLLSMLQGWTQWFLRPVLFSMMLLAVAYSIVYRWQHTGKADKRAKNSLALLFLIPIFFLWANLHPAFPLGLLILFSSVIATFFERRSDRTFRLTAIATISALATVSTFINPYNYKLHAYTLELVKDDYFMNLMDEWLSPSIYSPSFFAFWLTSFFLMFAVLRMATKKWSLFDALLLAPFFHMSVLHCRYIPFFGLVSAVPLAKAMQYILEERKMPNCSPLNAIAKSFASLSRKEQNASTFLFFSCFWLVLLVSTLYLKHLPGHTEEELSFHPKFPKDAVHIIENSAAGEKIFHTPNWGGYLAWHLYPKHKAFIDDRNQLNGRDKYEEFFTLNNAKPGWQRVIDKYKFYWLLLEPDAPLAYLLRDNPNWEIAHRDKVSLLLRQKD